MAQLDYEKLTVRQLLARSKELDHELQKINQVLSKKLELFYKLTEDENFDSPYYWQIYDETFGRPDE
jgi:hypothetical protein